MRKIYLLSIIALLSFSCSNEEFSEEDQSLFGTIPLKPIGTIDPIRPKLPIDPIDPVDPTLYYIMNTAPEAPECIENYHSSQTYDVELYLLSPLKHDAQFKFSLQSYKYHSASQSKYDFTYLISPWNYVNAKAGDRKIILNASCKLPDYIDCGDHTETITGYFRIKLENAKYLGTTEKLNCLPKPSYGKNYYDTKAYLHCLGGGWIENEPK